ncbi:hypothetical protein D3C73_1105320 [compost metagenome]
MHGLPLLGAHRIRRRYLPAEKIVDVLQHFQRAGIAFALHGADPLWVERLCTQLIGKEARGTARARRRFAQVRDVKRWTGAVEVTHGQCQATEVFERMVGTEQAVGIGRP